MMPGWWCSGRRHVARRADDHHGQLPWRVTWSLAPEDGFPQEIPDNVTVHYSEDTGGRCRGPVCANAPR